MRKPVIRATARLALLAGAFTILVASAATVTNPPYVFSALVGFAGGSLIGLAILAGAELVADIRTRMKERP